MGTGNFSPAYIEDFHALLMKIFHEFRLSKDEINTEVPMGGLDMNDIITSAKMEFYQNRPDAKTAGFENFDKKQ